mgnify:CR=1 FL=1
MEHRHYDSCYWGACVLSFWRILNLNKLMNLKYIFLPKPAPQESTILGRIGMVLYWIGVIWLFDWIFVAQWLDHFSNPTVFSLADIYIGIYGFIFFRSLLYLLANR